MSRTADRSHAKQPRESPPGLRKIGDIDPYGITFPRLSNSVNGKPVTVFAIKRTADPTATIDRAWTASISFDTPLVDLAAMIESARVFPHQRFSTGPSTRR